MDAAKAIDATEVVAVVEVYLVEEDVVATRISPTPPVTVLIYGIFLVISAVPIGMLFREMTERMLSINVFVKRLVA